jgi:AAA domain (Cdc48 subfamily)
VTVRCAPCAACLQCAVDAPRPVVCAAGAPLSSNALWHNNAAFLQSELLAAQVMEDGRLSDSMGRVVSFRDTLIVLTSNVGSHIIAKGGGRGLGFHLGADDESDAAQSRDAALSRREDDNVAALVREEFKSHFRPEFLNRLDEIVVHSLWGSPGALTGPLLQRVRKAAWVSCMLACCMCRKHVI